MSTDTKINTLIFNKLTQEQYNNADKVPTEFYLTPDTSIDSSEKGAANGVASLDTNGKVPTRQIPVATTSTLGGVKPDGTTITATADGVISAKGGSGTKRSIGEVYFSQSSLASDNPGALPLFTGETIASANTIYPDFYNWLIEHPELLIDIETYNQNISNFGESAKYIIGTQVEGNTVISYNLTKLNVTTLDKYHFGIFDSHNRFQEYFTDGSDVIAYCLYQDESNTGKQLLYVDKELTNRLYIKRINSDTSSKTGAAYIQKINYAGTLYRMLRFSTSEDVFYDNNTPSNIPFEQYNSYILPNGSLRLPLIKNYIKAANTADGIKNIEAGLPNITGQTGVNTTGGNGVFSNTIENIKGTVAISGYNTTTTTSNFDASRSSAVYGKSNTVTPASTTLYPWVVAYTAAIPASTAQAAEFQQGLSGKADTNLGNIPSNIDYVVEMYSDASGNWYRKYKSGWLEQGGYGKGNITFLKPYSSLPNVITGSANKKGDGWPARANEVTATGFYLYGGNQDTVSAYWEAKGQGGENV